ncbi:hypothetical protein [Pseudoxanthomonas suwonensis]|nr:hypothetical protein [Pseudoxanthomonas suwonensis]
MMATSNKVFVVVFVLFAAVNILDFAFYGQGIRSLVGAAGFALMAYGSFRNANPALVVGAVLALGSLVMKYVA